MASSQNTATDWNSLPSKEHLDRIYTRTYILIYGGLPSTAIDWNWLPPNTFI
jgi:hypothetical protein